jgi:hypothetical protein
MIGVIDGGSLDVEAGCIWRHDGSWKHTRCRRRGGWDCHPPHFLRFRSTLVAGDSRDNGFGTALDVRVMPT